MELPASIERSRHDAYGGEYSDLKTVAMAADDLSDQAAMLRATIMAIQNNGNDLGSDIDPFAVLCGVMNSLKDMETTLNDINGVLYDMPEVEA